MLKNLQKLADDKWTVESFSTFSSQSSPVGYMTKVTKNTHAGQSWFEFNYSQPYGMHYAVELAVKIIEIGYQVTDNREPMRGTINFQENLASDVPEQEYYNSISRAVSKGWNWKETMNPQWSKQYSDYIRSISLSRQNWQGVQLPKEVSFTVEAYTSSTTAPMMNKLYSLIEQTSQEYSDSVPRMLANGTIETDADLTNYFRLNRDSVI